MKQIVHVIVMSALLCGLCAGMAAGANEAPMLAEMVKAGQLPPLEERLPVEPAVLEPLEIGQYGGISDVGYVVPTRWNASAFHDQASMLMLDTDLKTVIPNLAKGWEFSPDGKSFTLFLREGVRWSDGAPFTADDVMFWYEDVFLNDELTPVKGKDFAPGGEPMLVEKVDAYTLRMSFAVPYPPFIYLMAGLRGTQEYFFLPKHHLTPFHPRYTAQADLDAIVKEAGYETWTQLFLKKADSDALAAAMEAGTPTLRCMALKSKTLDVAIFERNPYYWKVDSAGNQLPYFDGSRVKRYENIEIWNMKAITGELDIAHNNTFLANLPMYQEGAEKGGYRVLLWRNIWGAAVALKPNLNHNDPVLRGIFQDVRFRRALSLAIDRDEINEAVFMGLGVPRQASMPPTSAYFEDEFATAYAEFDLAAANALIDEMGLAWDEKKQWRLRPDGQPLTIVLEYSAEHAGSKTSTVELVKEYWAEIGVNLIMKEITRKTLLQREQTLDMDMTFWQMGSLSDAKYITGIRNFVPVSSRWMFWAVGWGRWYLSGGKEGTEPPEEVKKNQELVKKMSATMDEAERIRVGKELGRSLAENLWNIGTVGLIPKPVLIKHNVGNVPDEGVWDWAYMNLDVYHPESFFFRQ